MNPASSNPFLIVTGTELQTQNIELGENLKGIRIDTQKNNNENTRFL